MVVSARPWWSFDRSRWARPAAGAGVLAVAGAVDVAVGSGLDAELGAEAACGGALALGIGAGVALGRAWRGRSDDDVETYSPGVETILTGIGADASSPALARLDRGDTPLATLHQQATDGGEGLTVRARVGDRTLALEHRAGHRGGTEDDPDQAPPDVVLRLVDGDGDSQNVSGKLI